LWLEYIALRYADGTSPWRTDRAANSGADSVGYARESALLADFFLWLFHVRLSPKDHRYKFKRVHKAADFKMVSSPRISLVLRSMLVEYVNEHGYEALLPKRKEPATAEMLRRMRAAPTGAAVGRRRLDWEAPFFVSVFALLATCLSAAFRKNEVSLPNGKSFGKARASRASLRWKIGGRLYAAPSASLLRSLREGDFAIISPPPAKNDQFGETFGLHPIWLPYVSNDTSNAASALAALELALPVAPSARRSTPLFVIGLCLSPMTHSVIDGALLHLLLLIMSAIEAVKYSVHSFRIGCACALLASGASYEQIQALCRWKTTQSITVYARLEPSDYGAFVLRIARADPTSVTVLNLPSDLPIDADDYVAGIGEAADALARADVDSEQ
jgi:hypothetical protein